MDDLRLPLASNLPEYTVTELSGAVKRTLEGSFSRVRVRGEITELKRHSSGHIYLSLKDEGAKLGAVIWKSGLHRLGMVPENGVEVIATGRLTSYPERSCYQLFVDRLEYAGAGALLVRIEKLRRRLADEGLFAPNRKAPLPTLPSVVGVITSERGAVVQDIRTTIARRFARPILLWPVPVQGEGAAAKIAAAVRGFDAQRGALRPDVLIVARGGGSVEDLMAFNEEEVVRAVSDCRIPVISAVGHETDTTLIDFVADCRAPTPTAAAELAVPARAELLDRLHQTTSRLVSALTRQAQEQKLRLGRAERGLPDLTMLLGTARQRLDDRADRTRPRHEACDFSKAGSPRHRLARHPVPTGDARILFAPLGNRLPPRAVRDAQSARHAAFGDGAAWPAAFARSNHRHETRFASASCRSSERQPASRRFGRARARG